MDVQQHQPTKLLENVSIGHLPVSMVRSSLCAGLLANAFAVFVGVVYGCGVYFHENAAYSHTYAKQSAAGERTMFSARVLIGRVCQGNQSMKVAPVGYDTTTDGQHIFVIYHDAAAYAEHLITYR
jgi:hypothetical protein